MRSTHITPVPTFKILSLFQGRKVSCRLAVGREGEWNRAHEFTTVAVRLYPPLRRASTLSAAGNTLSDVEDVTC